MTRKRVVLAIAIILIITGIAVAGYPVFLMAQGHFEQRRLEKMFENYTVEPFLNSGNDNFLDAVPIWQEYEPFQLPQWEAFPPTKLEILSIDLDVHVVIVKDMSIYARRLSQPPGYYPQSAFPGEVGNVLIAGHRDGPAGYFKHLNKLKSGDVIILHAPGVSYHYEVEKVWIVEPTEVRVIAPLDYAALTLTTCQRVGTDPAARRLIVRAKFKEAFDN
jgi:sortase A